MKKINLLAKFKPEIYYLEVDPSWIQFSLSSDEIELLENCLQDKGKDGGLVIPLLNRFGVHPSENDSLGEVYANAKDTYKAFFEFVDTVSERCGLTRFEVIARIPEDLTDLTADIEEEMKSSSKENAKEIRENLLEVKRKLKNESIKITEQLGDYLPQLKALNERYEKTTADYYVALCCHFLNTSRVVDLERYQKEPNILNCLLSNTFTPESFEKLHRNFQLAMINFAKNQLSGGEEGEGKVA